MLCIQHSAVYIYIYMYIYIYIYSGSNTSVLCLLYTSVSCTVVQSSAVKHQLKILWLDTERQIRGRDQLTRGGLSSSWVGLITKNCVKVVSYAYSVNLVHFSHSKYINLA